MFKNEQDAQNSYATHNVPRGARSPPVKAEQLQTAPKPVIQDTAVESRQAAVPDGRHGRVFKPPARMKERQLDTDTTDMDIDQIVKACNAKPSSERSARPQASRKAPEVSANVLSDKSASLPRALKRGTEIKWRGYGSPKNTAVPECTVASGIHNFTGSGTNQYMTRYTCRGCGFVCSEPR